MKLKFLTIPALVLALVSAPLTNASAYGRGGYHDHGYRHGGPGWGVIAATGAIIGAAALLVTAPIRALEAEPAPAYYQPPQPVYYSQPQPVYYAPPPAYYAPQPVYYQAAPRYYRSSGNYRY